MKLANHDTPCTHRETTKTEVISFNKGGRGDPQQKDYFITAPGLGCVEVVKE